MLFCGYLRVFRYRLSVLIQMQPFSNWPSSFHVHPIWPYSSQPGLTQQFYHSSCSLPLPSLPTRILLKCLFTPLISHMHKMSCLPQPSLSNLFANMTSTNNFTEAARCSTVEISVIELRKTSSSHMFFL